MRRVNMSFTSIPHLNDPVMDKYYQELITNLTDFASQIINDSSNEYYAKLYQNNTRIIIDSFNHFQHGHVQRLNLVIKEPHSIRSDVALYIYPNNINPKSRTSQQDHLKIRLIYETDDQNKTVITNYVDQIKDILDQTIPYELYTLFENHRINN